MTFFELFARLGLVISGALGAGRGRRVPGPDERPARCVAERDLLMHLEFVDGAMLAQEVDVIVNAWNRNIIPWWLLIPQGVSGAIKKRGGTAPFRELARLGALPLGSSALTVAGASPTGASSTSVAST